MIMSGQGAPCPSDDSDDGPGASSSYFDFDMEASTDFVGAGGLHLSPESMSLQDPVSVTTADDIFGDTSHINEGLISDLLIDLSAGPLNQDVTCSLDCLSATSSVQISQSVCHADVTWSPNFLGGMASTSKLGSNLSNIRDNNQMSESIVSGAFSIIKTLKSDENEMTQPSKQQATFEQFKVKDDPDKVTLSVQDETSRSASTSTADDEEHWVLPPKRKPGRKPSTQVHLKRSNKEEDKGSMEYRLKRARNNIAIRKCREKARVKQEETEKRMLALESENERLKQENKDLKNTIVSLQHELERIKNS
ncbi:hypothetical protein FSP39_023857 [Pinctada imbricata]|uniref:BZIP domain-containing protein n=1 Tax=Pinctada imbricata TaxID=66713 RepID=A0AA88XSR2_PINIB|nr:hypothetical protein FSP39_023857 [Pinctada imbricata]